MLGGLLVQRAESCDRDEVLSMVYGEKECFLVFLKDTSDRAADANNESRASVYGFSRKLCAHPMAICN